MSTQKPLSLWSTLWLVMVSLMMVGSLYPFDFVFTESETGSVIWHWREPSGLADRVANVLMFTAPGFAVSLMASRIQRTAALLLLTSFAVALQILQMWLPGRVPSVDDIALNTVGLLAGTAMGRLLLHQCQHEPLPAVRFWRSVSLALWLAALLFPFATWTGSHHWQRAWHSLWRWPELSVAFISLSTWVIGLAQAQRLRPHLSRRRLLIYGLAVLSVGSIMRFRDSSALEIAGALLLLVLSAYWRWPAAAGRWAALLLLGLVAVSEWQRGNTAPLFSLSLWQFCQIMLYKALAWAALLDQPSGRKSPIGILTPLWLLAFFLDVVHWLHQGFRAETSHLVLLLLLWLLRRLAQLTLSPPPAQ